MEQLDADTQALLAREVAFSEIVPLRDALGLSLSLSQKATVADWYLAYAAAAKLRETHKTYSTLASLSLSVESEKTLAAAAVDRVHRQMVADARKYVSGKADLMSAPLKFVSGPEFSVRSYSSSSVSSAISAASRAIDDAASVPVSQYTIQDIFGGLMRARNELREVAATLRAEADARLIVAEENLLNDAWNTLLSSKGNKADIETAANFIQALNAKANGSVAEWDAVIAEALPEEHKAIEAALSKLTKAVSAIPRDVFDAELKRRNALLDHFDLPKFDQALHA